VALGCLDLNSRELGTLPEPTEEPIERQ